MKIFPPLRSLPLRLLLPIGLFFLTAAAPAQPTAPNTTQEVRVMVSLDKKPYTGLRQEDVRLTLDGQPVAITAWQEVHPSTEPLKPRILVFLDEAFALPAAVQPALRGLRHALTEHPSDLPMSLAIAAFDGERVDLLTPWTSSRAEVINALQAAQERPTFGLLRQSERRRHTSLTRRRSRLPDVGSFSATGFAGSTSSSWEDFEGKADLLRHPARLSARAAASTLEALNTGQGAALLLLSGGWLPPSAPAAECETLAEPLLQAVSRFGFAIYPVDVASHPAATAAHPTATAAHPTAAEESSPRDELLLRLAKVNGGVFIRSSAEATLRRALVDAQSHYRLSFLLPQDGLLSGGELRLEVAQGAAAEDLTERIVILPRNAPPQPQDAAENLFPLFLREKAALR